MAICGCVEQIRSANDSTAVGSHSLGGAENKLDDFFPFDPILLKGTARLINPLYNFWQEVPEGSHEEAHEEARSKRGIRESNVSELSCGSFLSSIPGGELSGGDSDMLYDTHLLGRSVEGMSVSPADELDRQKTHFLCLSLNVAPPTLAICPRFKTPEHII